MSNGCQALPANHLSVAAYMGQLITDRASFSKIHGVYFVMSWEVTLVRVMNNLLNIYDVAKRTCRKGFRRKQAFKVHELERIRATLSVDSCLRSLRLWTMILVMLAGFLRFDEVAGIKLKHVEKHSDHIKIVIPRSKGDIYRDGGSVVIAVIGGKLCPVDAIMKYISRAQITKKEELLFRAVTKTKKAEYLRKINSAISYQAVRSSVLKAASQAGIDVSTIGTHSLRAGGASSAANNGVEDTV